MNNSILAIVIVVIAIAAVATYGSFTGFIAFEQVGSHDNENKIADIVDEEPNDNDIIVGTPVFTGSEDAQEEPVEENVTEEPETPITGQITGGSGGSGGGGGSGGDSGTTCTPAWICSDWTPAECPYEQRQTRSCSDTNACGSDSGRPDESQACTYVPPAVEGNLTLSLIPSELIVNKTENERFMLDVYINSTEEVYAFELVLAFDPNFVTLEEVLEGDYLNKDGAKTSMTENEPVNIIDNINGKATIALTRLATKNGITGEGILVNMIFNINGSESSNIGFTSIVMVNPDLLVIPSTVQNSTVTVLE